MADDRMARSIEDSLIAYYASYASLPGASWNSTPACDVLLTGLKDSHFNAVLRARFDARHLDQRIGAAIASFSQRGIPAEWHLSPFSSPADLASVLVARGLSPVEDEPGMALDLATWRDETPTPPGLRVRPVDDDDALRAWVDVWGNQQTPDAVREQWFVAGSGLGFDPNRPLRHLLGVIDSQPVATAALFLSAGVAAVHHVVTATPMRRRGIGAAMTAAVLRQGRDQGARLAVLTASPDGYHVYHRLGFRPVCTFRTFLYDPATFK